MALLAGDNDWLVVRDENGESVALSLDGEKEAKHWYGREETCARLLYTYWYKNFTIDARPTMWVYAQPNPILGRPAVEPFKCVCAFCF